MVSILCEGAFFASFKTRSITFVIEVKGNFPDKNAATADSLVALKIAGITPPRLPDSKANSRPGYESVSIGKNCHV